MCEVKQRNNWDLVDTVQPEVEHGEYLSSKMKTRPVLLLKHYGSDNVTVKSIGSRYH